MASPTDVSSFRLESRFGEPIAVHAVSTPSHTVLFGGGDTSTTERYVEVVDEVEPDVIVVEHGDPDHYGSLPALPANREAPLIAVPAGDAPAVREEGIEPDVLLEADTDRWGIRTIGVPGHTPDNMAYLHGDVLFAGDTVVGADSIFAADDDWSGPLAVITPEYSDDDALARESVRTLLDHAFDAVLVAHGSDVETAGREAVETLVVDLSIG